MSRIRTKTPTFRFNRNDDDLIEEVYEQHNEFNDDCEHTTTTTTTNTANTPNTPSNATPLASVSSLSSIDNNVNTTPKMDRTLREYIASRLNKNKSFDDEKDKDKDTNTTSNWFHDIKGKIKEKIEEKKREKEMKSVIIDNSGKQEDKCDDNVNDVNNKTNGDELSNEWDTCEDKAESVSETLRAHNFDDTEQFKQLTIEDNSYFSLYNEYIDNELIDDSNDENEKKSVFCNFSQLYLIICSGIAFISFLIALTSPLPTFLNGLLFGIFLTLLLLSILFAYIIRKFFIQKSNLRKIERNHKLINNINKEVINSGWMYELLGNYDNSDTIFKTQLIYVRLNGQNLRLSKPKQDNRKLKLDSNHLPLFISQRIFDLSKMKHKNIYLFLPKSVKNQKKYIWSKKFPICLELEDNRTKEIVKIILFIRNCRDKEEWFYMFREALNLSPKLVIKDSKNTEVNTTISDPPTPRSTNHFISEETEHLKRPSLDLSSLQDLTNYSQTTSPTTPAKELQILSKHIEYGSFIESIINFNSLHSSSLTWFNALIGRICFDILNEQFWSNWIAIKIQRKLRRIKLPYFMESLTITEIDVGNTLPKFNQISKPPVVDDKGLWIDFEISYSGGFTMTLETKLNLMKLKEQGVGSQETKSLNSDIEISDNESDSIMSSSEEEVEDKPLDPDNADTTIKQQKILKFVDKIASSQYFQKAAENKYIKRAMEGVSKTALILTVQIQTLNGTLAINIPKPPTDRLWYGFRGNPDLVLSARPKLGEHELSIHQVTDIIERKLRQEFAKVLVMPNMDDLFIPVLMTNIDQFIIVV